MELPRRLQPGRVLRVDDIRRLRDAAKQVVSPALADGYEGGPTPGGLLIKPTLGKYKKEDCVLARLTPWESPPLWGVVEFCGAIEGRYNDPILECRKPTQSGFSRLGILRSTMAANNLGWIQIRAYAPLLYIISTIPTGTTLSEGHRLGCLKNSYYAQWDTLGSFKVRGIQGTSDGYGVAIVEITRERADYKMVDTGGQCDGAYQTIIWSSQYTVAETSPGKITVT